MEIKKIPTLEQKQAFWAEQLPSFEAKYWLPSHFKFLTFDMDQGNYAIKDDLDPSFEDDATEIFHRVNTGWAMWKKAIKFTEQQATHHDAVFVPTENVEFFSHDLNGDGFKYHETLEEAKKEAEANLDYYRDRVADGHHVESDGEFNELCFGIVIGSADYSVDDVVTKEHHSNGDYTQYEIGTEILSLSLNEKIVAEMEQNHD